jgi:hypothetical protein
MILANYVRALPIRAGLVVISLLSLDACVETRFEAPLGDNIETCDTRWKGLWTGADNAPAARDDDTTAFYVDDDCTFTVLEQPEKGGALKRIHVPVNYVHADGKDYIVVADSAIKGLVTLKSPHAIEPKPGKSFFFARYRMHGNRIELYPVDSPRVAKLVIDGKLDGTVDKTPSELHVFVRGNRAQMLDMVRAQSIFDEASPLKLVRSGQTIDAFEQSLQRNPHGKKP